MLKNKQLISLIISILILLAVTVFVIYPYGTELSVLKDSIHKERITLAQKKKQQDDVVKLQKQFKELQENAQKLNTAFIAKDTDDLITIIEEIERIAEQLSLEEELSIPKIPTPEDTTTTESTIDLNLTGSYEDIYSFIEALESQPTYFSFDSLEITASKEVKYRALLSGTIYWK